jgi:hypothetical protein
MNENQYFLHKPNQEYHTLYSERQNFLAAKEIPSIQQDAQSIDFMLSKDSAFISDAPEMIQMEQLNHPRHQFLQDPTSRLAKIPSNKNMDHVCDRDDSLNCDFCVNTQKKSFGDQFASSDNNYPPHENNNDDKSHPFTFQDDIESQSSKRAHDTFYLPSNHMKSNLINRTQVAILPSFGAPPYIDSNLKEKYAPILCPQSPKGSGKNHPPIRTSNSDASSLNLPLTTPQIQAFTQKITDQNVVHFNPSLNQTNDIMEADVCEKKSKLTDVNSTPKKHHLLFQVLYHQ